MFKRTYWPYYHMINKRESSRPGICMQSWEHAFNLTRYWITRHSTLIISVNITEVVE